MRIEKPYRVRQEGSVVVARDADEVFALMCPVREYEWEPGWKTNLILSESGLVEEDCVFTTPGGARAGSTRASAEAVWVTPFYDAQARRLTMIKFTPRECVTRLDIDVAPVEDGSRITISYAHTALSEVGRRIVDDHNAANFRAMLARWKGSIEKYLGTKNNDGMNAAE